MKGFEGDCQNLAAFSKITLVGSSEDVLCEVMTREHEGTERDTPSSRFVICHSH